MLSSTGSTFGDARCSMDGATFVRLASPGDRCLFSTMTWLCRVLSS